MNRSRLSLLTLICGAAVFGLMPRELSSQAVPNREAALEIRTRFLNDLDTLQSKIVALAEAFPAEKYAWRPAPGVRSVAEVLMHVASEYYVYTPMSYGAARSSVIPQGRGELPKFEVSATAKADVIKHLKDSFAFTKQALNGIDAAQLGGTRKLFGGDRTIVETTLIMSGDLHEHLGQLIAYARMNGVTPPWSR
jgi:hypothetical protein